MGKLEQGLQQKMMMKMSPQQIAFMKLLQVPTASLEERIKEELEANPALDDTPEDKIEEVEEFKNDETPEVDEKETPEDAVEKTEAEIETEAEEKEEKDELDELDKLDSIDEYLGAAAEQADYMDYDEVAEYKLKQEVDRDEQEKKQVPLAMSRSFNEYLEVQLGNFDLTERQRELAEYMIGSIDDDGYLRRPIDAMVDDLAFSFNVQTDEKELLEILDEIQALDPPGVGARDLKECLLLQLYRKTEHPKQTDISIQIIEKHFDSFTKKHYEKLQKTLELDDVTFKKVMNEILHLNPKPGNAYTETDNTRNFLVPDFYIMNNDGKLEVSLNSRNVPELRVSNSFKQMLQDYHKGSKTDKKQKEALLFVKQKIDSAKWFIDAIKQRQNTLLMTMEAILDHQREFFLTGDETTLKPMILKDIAERTHQDISTVSRVGNSKFVQTEFGTYKLKYFFAESLSTDEGEEVSTREVKKILMDLIDAESKKHPLSDQKLMQLLNEKGYNIARRTVAKYREQLNIPVARLRTQI